MTDEQRRAGCLDANMMAEYIDGGLEPRQRAEVEAHLAECGECYETFAETVRITAAEPAAVKPTAGPRRRVWLYAAASLIVIVASAVLIRRVLPPSDPTEEALRAMIAATGTQRFSEARLAEAFAWGQAPSPTRGTAAAPPPPLAAQEAAIRLRRLAEAQPNARALHGAGIGLLALGQISEAVDMLGRASRLTPGDTTILSDLAASLIERGRSTDELGDTRRALEIIEGAREIKDSTSLRFNRALALEGLGATQLAVRAWEDFLKGEPNGPWADEARTHLKKLSVPHASAGDDLNSVYARLQFDLVRTWAAAMARGEPSPPTAAEAAVALAADLARSSHDNYFEHLTTLMASVERVPIGRRRAIGESIVASCDWYQHIDAGDYESADRLATRASELAARAHINAIESTIQQAYSNLAAGRAGMTLQQLTAVQQRAHQSGFSRLEMLATRVLAVKAMAAAEVSGAEQLFRTGLLAAQRAGDADGIALFRTFLSQSFSEQGDTARAWQELRAALTLLPQVRSRRQAYDTLAEATWQAREGGYPKQARLFAEALRDATDAWTNPEGRITARLELARSELDLGHRGQAMAALEAAERDVPNMVGRVAARERLTAEISTHKASILGPTDVNGAIAAATVAIAFFSQSFTTRAADLLLTRGRLYKAAGNPQLAAADWERAARLIEDQRPNLRDEQLRISRTAALWGVYAELIRAAQPDPRASLLISERASARELLYSLAPRQQVNAVDLSAIQRSLAKGETAIVFRQLPEALLRWDVTTTDVHLDRLPITQSECEQLAATFAANAVPVLGASPERWLGRLLPPRVAIKTDLALLVIPDGALTRIPFSALRASQDGPYLAELRPVIMAPSLATYVLASRAGRRATARSLVAVGVANAAPGKLPLLAGARQEARAVGRNYGGPIELIDDDATATAVAGALRRGDVIHIATHATADTVRPDRSRLYFAGGTSMTPADISAARGLRGAIVVIGACSAANGASVSGEGMMSLSRAFLAAGAATVIAPLWPIRDADSLEFMGSLHRRLAHGADPVVALVETQRELIQSGRHPDLWAAFVAIGGHDHGYSRETQL